MTGGASLETRGAALAELSALHGIVPSYTDVRGEVRTASSEAVLAVLRSLGVPVTGFRDVPDALRERREALHRRLVEPVTVVWEGDDPVVEVHLAGAESGLGIECRLETEEGEVREWVVDGGPAVIPGDLPCGYHVLQVRLGPRRRGTSRVIVAPRRARDPERRGWGAFLPLYALRTSRGWGVGDLGDLERLAAWVGGLGGDAVATLPMLAVFLGGPLHDPSPYAPVSRLFWNELFVDVARAPELERSEEARAIVGSAAFRGEASALRRRPYVGYREAIALKRRVLEPLARAFFSGDEWRDEPFYRFLADHPEARTYASFRAACEVRGEPWRRWPDRMREGDLREGDYDENVARTHLYAQWLAARQLDGLVAGREARGAGLHLDLPLGVHADGFDTWRWPGLFAGGASVGAPPDDFMEGGQDWGTPPLHPERSREEGHAYFTASLRTLLRRADAVRLDHVMGLHRQFWVPRGMDATDGVYVRYPADEMWAVACLESHRSGSALVGEDLGTVPDEVRETMARRGARRTYVVPFHLGESGLDPVPELAVASLNTHDMPPFAAWWGGLDPRERERFLDALDRAGHLDRKALGPGAARPGPVVRAALGWVAASPARHVSVNLEDLWLEPEPQNEPGTTTDERPNWRRKARYAFELFSGMPEVTGILEEVDRLRAAGEEEGEPA